MKRTVIVMLRGAKLETEIPLDELYILYKQVVQKRATIVIEVFSQDKKGSFDIRLLDPNATFTPKDERSSDSGVIV